GTCVSCCSNKETELTNECCSSDADEKSTSAPNHEESLIQIIPSQSKAEPDACCDTTEEITEPVNDLTQTNEKIEFKMHGMDCPSCATTIEKGLERLTNVVSANVSYNTEKLHLVVADCYSLPEVEGTSSKLGFSAEPINQNNHLFTYNVEGMDCGSCAKSIENHLSKLQDVNHVNVNFALGNMKVDHTLSHKEIEKEVGKLGFQTSLETRNKDTKKSSKNNEELLKVIASGVLIATGFIGTYTGLPEIISIIL